MSNSNDKKYFHFTIGPVQGFVSQARRTRDFWGGSFLLSWLAGVAMVVIKKQGGTIEFPQPDDSYLLWIEEGNEDKGKGSSKVKSSNPPQQGAIPNRFMGALTATVPDSFDEESARILTETVRNAWEDLAETIWKNDIEGVISGSSNTRRIWERQIRGFWEISWILTETEESNFLDRRKNWRNYFPQEEPGVKCMVMDGWQELSGAEQPGTGVKKFWNTLRKSGRTGIETDLREGEHLCSIALVKRRFTRYFEQISWDSGITYQTEEGQEEHLTIHGWQLAPTRPSVSYMAAVHWIEKLLSHEDAELALRIFELVGHFSPERSEWGNQIHCIEEKLKESDTIFKREHVSVDGEIFFESERENIRKTLLQQLRKTDQNSGEIKDRLKLLEELDQKIKESGIGAPSPFYAILLMDGDSLGSHMGTKCKQGEITESLNQFTQSVQEITEKNNGFLVYAGGDDVLAILPLEDAFACARDLHKKYGELFRGTSIPSTLSGAIEFAHIKMPLGQVLKDAHSLLDDIAKDSSGRDAIAARIWKPGGLTLTWSQPWQVALGQEGKKPHEYDLCADVVLQTIADRFAKQDEEGAFSNNFFYKIREQLELLNPPGEKDEPVLNEGEAIDLLTAEYLSSGVNLEKGNSISSDQAKTLIEPLLQQCRARIREVDDTGTAKTDSNNITKFKDSKHITADAALLVRFLIQKGAGER